MRAPSLQEVAVSLPRARSPRQLAAADPERRAHASIVLRDICLTATMRLIFVFMLQGESSPAGSPSTGSSPRSDGGRAGGRRSRASASTTGGAGQLVGLPAGVGALLMLALLLIIALVSFGIDTINRRRVALAGPRPPPLPLAVEAHHAELASMPGPLAAAAQARRAAEVEASVLDDVPLDPRALLLVLDQLDEAALEEARGLRITRVQVTADGHYRIWPDE